MKYIKSLLLVLLLISGTAIPAAAKFRVGPRVGMTVNSLHFNDKVFDSENKTGFTAGLQVDFTVPVIGVGFDVSAMYVRRSAQWMEQQKTVVDNRDYFEIPVNLKWKLGIPVISPYLFTGPSFAFLTSRRAVNDAWRNKSVDTAWNIGLGVELLSHLQLSARYGIGLNKAMQKTGLNQNSEDLSIRNRAWTITAAYMF